MFQRFGPRTHSNRKIFASDVTVIIPRLRAGDHQIAVNRLRDFEVTINGAVYKFDFQNVPAFAVADRRDATRANLVAWNVRDHRIVRFALNVLLRRIGCRQRQCAKQRKQ